MGKIEPVGLLKDGQLSTMIGVEIVRRKVGLLLPGGAEKNGSRLLF